MAPVIVYHCLTAFITLLKNCRSICFIVSTKVNHIYHIASTFEIFYFTTAQVSITRLYFCYVKLAKFDIWHVKKKKYEDSITYTLTFYNTYDPTKA